MTYTAAAAIKAATGEIGYRESGTNRTKFNNWLGSIDGTTAYPWCASFQSWVADKAGGRANIDYPKTAGCLVAVDWFKGHGRWSTVPHVGDWVLYGPGGGTHVELVAAVTDSTITTIGGNTSGSLDGQYFNGDGVYRKQVARNSSRIYGYGRPAYATEEDDMQLDDKVPVGETYKDAYAHSSYPLSYLLVMGAAEAKRARVAAEASNAALGEMAKTVAALAADRGQDVDADALVARITQAIENVTVHLDVTDGS